MLQNEIPVKAGTVLAVAVILIFTSAFLYVEGVEKGKREEVKRQKLQKPRVVRTVEGEIVNVYREIRLGSEDGTTVIKLPNGTLIKRIGRLGKRGDKIKVHVYEDE